MSTNLRRIVVALATVIAGVGLVADPASATLIDAQVTGGTVTVAKAGQPGFIFPLVSVGTGCGSIAAALDIAVPSSPGTVDLPTLATAARFTPFGGTVVYVAEVTRTNSTPGTGAVVTGPDTITGLGANITITFFVATDQSATGTSCTHGSALCTWGASYSFGGSYSGNLTAPAVGDAATIGTPAGTALTGTPCNAPFNVYTAGSATFTSVVLQLLAATYPIQVTGGTVTYTGTVANAVIPLVTAGAGCGSSGQMDIGVFGTTGAVSFAALASTARFQLPPTLGTNVYIAEFSRTASTAGTGSTAPNPDTITGTGLTLRADIYLATDQSTTGTSCARGTTRLCRFTTTHSLTGTYSGDLSAPAATDTATLSAPTVANAVAPPCGVPLATYVGGTATLSSMGVVLP